MKKPKFNFDAAKLQDFLFHHVEKILLAVVVGLMLLLVWQGFSMRGLEGNLTPQMLKQTSQEVMEFIDNPVRWEEIKDDRTPTMDIRQRVEITHRRTDPQAYFLPVSINRPNFPKHAPRTDPKLLAPENVIAVGIFGPLAVYAKLNELDPLVQKPLEDLELPPVVLRNKAKKKKKTNEYGGEYGEYGSPDGGMPGPGGRQPKSKRGKRGRGGEADPYGEGTGGEYQPPGQAGGYGEGGYGAGGYGMTEGDKYQESYLDGFVPQSAEMTIAKSTGAIVVSAVVPFLKQTEEYERALNQSLDFDASRDFPLYLKFEVQRADVTADPDGAIDWSKAVLIDPTKVKIEQLGRPEEPARPDAPMRPAILPTWAGFAPEVVDPSYLDYVPQGGRLTHPAPPFLQRDLWPLITHPDVPLATSTMYGEGGAGAVGPDGEEAGAGGDPSGDLFMPPSAAGGGYGGMPGAMGGSPDGGYGGMGGIRGGMPGPGGFRGGGEAMGGGMPGPAMGGGYGGMGGGYGGMAGGYGEGGYGGMGGYGTQPIAPPKYKLIRMTDTKVQSGKKYSYRVRVWLHDPNHPATQIGFIAPSLASLHGDVQKRIKEVEADLKSGKIKDKNLANVVLSDWSAPSAPAELPPVNRFYAMSMPAPKAQTLVKDRPQVPTDQPKAEAVAVTWDHTKVVDVPSELTVFRGSVLAFVPDPKADPLKDPKSELKVIHPVTKQVVPMPKYGFTTSAIVADIQGGEPISPLDKANPNTIFAPCEMLVVDAKGGLHVLNEVDDIENVRRFTFPKPPDPSTMGTPDGGFPGGEAGGYDPLGSPDGGPGPGGGRQPRRRGGL
jgi:hypothetical protein